MWEWVWREWESESETRVSATKTRWWKSVKQDLTGSVNCISIILLLFVCVCVFVKNCNNVYRTGIWKKMQHTHTHTLDQWQDTKSVLMNRFRKSLEIQYTGSIIHFIISRLLIQKPAKKKKRNSKNINKNWGFFLFVCLFYVVFICLNTHLFPSAATSPLPPLHHHLLLLLLGKNLFWPQKFEKPLWNPIYFNCCGVFLFFATKYKKKYNQRIQEIIKGKKNGI